MGTHYARAYDQWSIPGGRDGLSPKQGFFLHADPPLPAQFQEKVLNRIMKLPDHPRRRAFTLVEIMVAITMFMMMMISVMACWKVIVSGTRTGETAAAMAQRARTSMRAIEDSLNNMYIPVYNNRYYYFTNYNKDQYACLDFAARLPSTFLGSDYFGDNVVRHVIFQVQPDPAERDKLNLVMTQYPVLAIPSDQYPPKSIILARDVSLFTLSFWSPKDNEWHDDFLPKQPEVPPMILITLGTGHSARDAKVPFEVIQRVVRPPTMA